MQPPVPHWRKSLEAVTLKMKCSAPSRWVKSLQLDSWSANLQLLGTKHHPVCLPPLQDDLCFQGYLRHMSSCSSPAPLTAAEQELQRIKVTEVKFKPWKMFEWAAFLMCDARYVCSSCMLLLFFCRIKLYGYVVFLPDTNSSVCVHKEDREEQILKLPLMFSGWT